MMTMGHQISWADIRLARYIVIPFWDRFSRA
jgi:hypothetical protein